MLNVFLDMLLMYAVCFTEPATAIAVGYSHTCVLRAGGSVVCFGFNSYGQLGINSTAKYVYIYTNMTAASAT
jgi:alpha-tubulin suppressor-like RCC1 family protein